MPNLARHRALPLILGPDDAFAHSEGAVVRASAFRASGASLAERLAPAGEIVNLCDNRYRFLVAFAAAVSRGQTTLLPSSHAPSAVAELVAAYPGCGVLDDAFVAGGGRLETSGSAESSEDFVAAISHTSGSTGTPVTHAKSWSGLCAATTLNAAAIRTAIVGPAAAQQPWIVATVPPQHMYGLEMSVLLPLIAGFGIHSGKPLLPADVAAALDEVPAPRVLVSTPVHLRSLVEAGARFPEVAAVVSATAPLTQALALRIEQRFSAVLVEMFGSTETCVIATRQTAREQGWRPYPGIRFESAAAGTIVNAPWLATKQLLHDFIEMHADGSFTVIGRHGDLLEVAGKRASLADLTRRLADLPGVHDAVIFQPPSEDSGHARRCAALVVAPGSSAREIARRFRQVVDPAFVPRPLVIVPTLPRNEVGKLPLDQLLKMLAATRES